MPQPVNRAPPGILSLLNAKGGVTVPLLGDELSPTLEMSEFYTQGFATPQYGDSVPITVRNAYQFANSGYNFKPDPGHILVIDYACCGTTAVIGAGATYEFQLVVMDVSAGPRLGYPILSSRPQTGAAGEQPIVSLERRVVITPGFALGLWIKGLTGAPANSFFCFARVTDLVI